MKKNESTYARINSTLKAQDAPIYKQSITTVGISDELNTQQKGSSDRITIGLYSVETIKEEENKTKSHNYSKAFLAQLENVAYMKEKFTRAAKNKNRTPPELVVLINLVPDWKSGSSYEDKNYQENKERLFKELNDKLVSDKRFDGVEFKYFYDKANEIEKAYLKNLISKGSNADMIKTHAIIDEDNRKRRHLQLDSNTQISNYQNLYDQTFGAEQQQDACEALNASYYDPDTGYVSAHNKIVYTHPNGKIASSLKNYHLNYCKEHANDHASEDEKVLLEKTEKNSIYAKDFAVSLSKIGLTEPCQATPQRTIYLAVLDKPEYRITKNIVTAVNQSWANTSDKEMTDEQKHAQEKQNKLKALPTIPAGDAKFDYACFITTQNKYTRPLDYHKPKNDNCYDDTEAYNQLMSISDVADEKQWIKNFIINVAKNKPDMLDSLLNEIQPTPRAIKFYGDMFNFNASDCKPESMVERIKQAVLPSNTIFKENDEQEVNTLFSNKM